MLRVRSEIGHLREVLVHEPGPEVDGMVPSMMEELLFDDILFGERAREEHRRMRRVMQLLGVKVREAADLLAEALAEEDARAWLLEVLVGDLPGTLRPRLAALSAPELARALVAGLRREGEPEGIAVDDLYEVPPLPNLCFQRDPQVVLGDGVVFGAMATPARYREAVLSRAIFRFHPRYREARTLHDPLQPGRNPLLLGIHRPRLEGGDVAVISPEVVVVGVSERTNRTAVHLLARALAERVEAGGPRWLFAVELPRRRAYMHLDTVFTVLDRDACLVHAPVILPGGTEQARVAEVDLAAPDPTPRPVDDLLGGLRRRGIDLEPIPCGGADPVDQHREQWTDGANAFALCPGVVMLYDRNVRTVEELGKRGFSAVPTQDLLLGRAEIDLDRCGRTAILLESTEVTRARGGPHCLCHPLVREDA